MNTRISSSLLSAAMFLALVAPGLAHAAEPAKKTEAKSPDAAVAALVEKTTLKHEIDEDGDVRFVFNWDDEKRTQLAFVGGSPEALSSGERIVEVFSPAWNVKKKPLTLTQLQELMADSGRKKVGSWEQRGDFVYFVVKVPLNMKPELLKELITLSAELADNQELAFGGKGSDDL